MQRKNIIYILAIVLLFSCQDNSNTKEKTIRILEKNKSIAINDQITNSHPIAQATDSPNTFTIYDYKNNNIHLFDLKESKYKHSVHIDHQGPNGIGSIGNIQITNDSTYYVYYNKRLKLFHHNTVYKSFRYDGKSPLKVIQFSEAPLIKHKESYRLPTGIIGNYMLSGNNEISNQPLSIIYNELDGTFTEGITTYPDTLYENQTILGSPSYSFCINNNGQRLYLFSNNSNLFIDKGDTELSRLKLKNPFHKGFIEPNSLSQQQLIKSIMSSPEYISIKFDPYRSLYYILYKPMIEVRKKQLDNYHHFFRYIPELVLLVLDEDLNTIASKRLPSQKYLSRQILINEEGLFIGENHPDQAISEDSIYFSKFTIE